MTSSTNKNTLPQTLLNAAWMAVLLGLGMEIILLAVAAGFQKSTSAQAIVADLIQKISWSTFVCVGVAVGTTAGRMRSQMMGLAGLIAAPIAFNVAKALHKSAAQALSVAGPVAVSGPSPFLLALIKGLEYAALGFVIGQISKSSAGLRSHALAGGVIGVVFGGTIVYLMVSMSAQPIPAVGIVSRCVNELIFPVGCAVVLYAAQKLGDKNRID